MGKLRGGCTMISFFIGNTYEEVSNPKPSRSDPTKLNKHRWTMFVCMPNGDSRETIKYIKSVNYILDETFIPPVV